MADTNKENNQHERFKEAARQLGCDEDEAAFDEKLKVIGRQRPSPDALKPAAKARQQG